MLCCGWARDSSRGLSKYSSNLRTIAALIAGGVRITNQVPLLCILFLLYIFREGKKRIASSMLYKNSQPAHIEPSISWDKHLEGIVRGWIKFIISLSVTRCAGWVSVRNCFYNKRVCDLGILLPGFTE